MKIITAVFLSLFLSLNAFAFTANGFSNPYGVVIDQKTGMIYVGNVNGDPDSKDDNGFISRLKNDGTVDQIRFIDGAAPNITLHAPKGMAILGNFLYVCDIDALRAFDLNTGKQLFDVNFGELPRQRFYSVVVGPDGALYLADAGVNAVYRIDITKQHEVTLFTAGEDLGGPHGLVWYPARQMFVVAGGDSGQVTAYDRSGKRQQVPAIVLKALEGIDVDDAGSMYVASRDLSAAYRIAATFALSSYQLGLSSPAGVAYNRAAKEIIIASFAGNMVQSYPVIK